MKETKTHFIFDDGERFSKEDYYLDKFGYVCHKSTKVLSVNR